MGQPIYPTPGQIKEISDRFTQHQESLKYIINSDKEVLFPPFTGAHPDKEFLERTLSFLEESSKYLSAFTKYIEQNITDSTHLSKNVAIENIFM